MTQQRNLEKQMHSLLAGRFKPNEPGVAVIVVRDGHTLFRKGYGMADLELGVRIQPDMVFRLGSITKQFTAVAILMLEARGKLSVQDRIGKYIPRYPVHGHKLTIEHLLTHTSGIKSYTSMPEFHKEAMEDKSVADHIKLFKDRPMAFAPGERWDYNNSGYFLLGAIIEHISGQSYQDFLQRNIFDTLGMTHTYYDLPSKIIPGRVMGYGRGPNGIENTPYLSMTRPYAAGSLASSVDDLAKWDAALHSNTLVSQSTLQRAWTPYQLKSGKPTRYGYGWAINAYDGHPFVHHGGGINGFITHAIHFPEQRAYVAVLGNSTSPATQPSYIAFNLAALAIGKPYAEPEPIALSRPALDKFVGPYVDVENPNLKLKITRVGKQLLVQFSEAQPPQELHSFAPTEFFIKDSLLRLRFVPASAGNGVELQFREHDALVGTAVKELR